MKLSKVTALLLALCLLAGAAAGIAEEPSIPEVSMDEVNREYDDAMNTGGAMMTFYLVPSIAGNLSYLMDVACGPLPEAAPGDAGNAAVQLVDQVVLWGEWCFSGGETAGSIDVSGQEKAAFDSAVAEWKAKREEFITAYNDPSSAFDPKAGLNSEEAAIAAADAFERMPFEAQAAYLESAYQVLFTVQPLLKGALVKKTAVLFPGQKITLPDLTEAGNAAQAGLDFLSGVKTFLSVGFDQERYEKRIRIEQVKNRLNTLDQFLILTCRLLKAVNP